MNREEIIDLLKDQAVWYRWLTDRAIEDNRGELKDKYGFAADLLEGMLRFIRDQKEDANEKARSH